jgi:predicted RecB family nuclease
VRVKANHHQPGMRRAVDSINLTQSSLSKGDPLILDGVFETDLISLHVDGLQRVVGSSGIGNFHYLPCVKPSGAYAGDTQKVLLDVVAFILSRFQRRAPDKSIIWRSEEKSSAVQLSPDLKRGERILNALTEMQRGEHTPMLNLNRHCAVCEYQSRCHTQAVGEDNLSLLRGISEAEMGRLRKKGIFTINQLSYTFRPRRIKKRAKNPAHPHYFALQAQAIREKKY